jgi:hypothetical protein
VLSKYALMRKRRAASSAEAQRPTETVVAAPPSHATTTRALFPCRGRGVDFMRRLLILTPTAVGLALAYVIDHLDRHARTTHIHWLPPKRQP